MGKTSQTPKKSRRLRWRTILLFVLAQESYLPDGSFKVSELDETLGDAYFYGVSFLVDAGYFNPEKRFWTNQDFIDAPVVREKLENKLRSTGLNDPQLRDAYSMLISSVVM